VRRGEASRYLTWLDACHSSLHRFAAKRASVTRLAEVGQWMQPAWVQEALERITGNGDTTANLAQIAEARDLNQRLRDQSSQTRRPALQRRHSASAADASFFTLSKRKGTIVAIPNNNKLLRSWVRLTRTL